MKEEEERDGGYLLGFMARAAMGRDGTTGCPFSWRYQDTSVDIKLQPSIFQLCI